VQLFPAKPRALSYIPQQPTLGGAHGNKLK